MSNSKRPKEEAFNDFYNLLYVAAFGANQRCKEEIERMFYEYHSTSKSCLYLFFEYFLSTPLPKNNVELDLKNENVFLLAPFAPRLVEQNLILPEVKNVKKIQDEMKIKNLDPFTSKYFKFCFRTDDKIKEMKLAFRFDKLAFTKWAYEKWATGKNNKKERDNPFIKWIEICDPLTNHNYNIGYINNWKPIWQISKYIKNRADADPDTFESILILSGFFKEIFSDKLQDSVPGVFIPICSSNLFYGGIWLILPHFDLNSPKNNKIFNSFSINVTRLINKFYLPSLTFLHEHWLERKISEEISKKELHSASAANFIVEMELKYGGKIKYFNFYNKMLEPKNADNKSNTIDTDEIEKRLFELWENRFKMSEEKFLDSLLFKNYLAVSESMCQCIYQVIISASTMGKRNDTLPACLIIGGAGSGKEKLAKIVKIFSSEYLSGDTHIINLAAIRPAPLTAAIMVGSELGNIFPFQLDGVITKIFQKQDNDNNKPTLILDEFNSMDPDSQGILLRFLDNSEVLPIGSISPKAMINDMKNKISTNCLVIGVMNEDPDDISRENAIDFFKNNQYLGGFFSDMFYEHFMKIRRLRPDVKYRMIRNGKFIIPLLKNRIEDIPLLFYVYVKDELKEICKLNIANCEISVHLTLSVLKRLTSKDLLWQGNVRQLQALAKFVSQTVWINQNPKTTNKTLFHFSVHLCELEDGLNKVGLT